MLVNEAADALMMGIATAADIETAMTKGVNYPQGLLAWANKRGLRTVYNKLDDLFAYYGEDRYRVCPLTMEKTDIEYVPFYENWL